ncbi:hypothetical protein [Rahnella laticis]|uniref:hypothetical protein n=1 Tax=Rahnella laticis TaxID=2787622 RepID=UPI0018A2CB0F|nr:hypothetical protein [Rahnella laticis]MBF7995442.1 hypothetical protein [Rahnella laticis]
MKLTVNLIAEKKGGQMYRKSEEAKYKESLNKLLNIGMRFVMLDPDGNIVKPFRQNHVAMKERRRAHSIVTINSLL